MTREDALEVFSAVKERSEHFKECGCRFPLWTITERDEEAIDIAIEALQATEHDGCEGCKYTHKDQYEMPCLMCKQSKEDLWERGEP